jgi:hypothetical protein
VSSWETAGQSDDWLTPQYIFDALRAEFSLDPADHPKSRVPAKASFYSNGLGQAWHGFVWLNPPYGARNGLDAWLTRFLRHGDGVALVPDRSSAPWFQKAAKRMDALLFLSPKVKFERPDGTRGEQPGTGSVLMATGAAGSEALQRGKRLGLLVTPATGG